MGAEARQRIVDRPRAVAKQRILVARGERHRRFAFPVLRNGRRFEERLDAIEYGRVAGSVHVTQGHIGEPEMRVRGVGAIAKPGAAVRRPVPPFDRVAFEELMRRVQQNLRPRARGLQKDERDHVLQLIAIAGRARALRGARPAPKPRRQQLIGQPVVDQAIEVGLVCLDPQHRGLGDPGGAALRQRGQGESRIASLRREPLGVVQRAGLAMRQHDQRLAAGRHVDRAAESRDLALMRGSAGVGMTVLDHIRQGGVSALMAEESAARRLREFGFQRGRNKGPALHEIIARIAEIQRLQVLRGRPSRSRRDYRSASRRERSP